MKKIKYLIVTILAFMVIIPGVDAKEINVSNLELDKEIDVKIGDKIVYNSEENKDNFSLSRVTFMGEDGTSNFIYAERMLDDKDKYQFVVPTAEEIFTNPSLKVTEGKRVKIKLSNTLTCGVAFTITLTYYVVDDNLKRVIYNNTFDAVNNNPTSYLESETDILLKDIKRDGYSFLGWYKTSDYQEDSRTTIIDINAPEVLNLYAKWEKNKSVNEEIVENPMTYASTYIIVGIFVILMLSTVVVYVYGKKQEIK